MNRKITILLVVLLIGSIVISSIGGVSAQSNNELQISPGSERDAAAIATQDDLFIVGDYASLGEYSTLTAYDMNGNQVWSNQISAYDFGIDEIRYSSETNLIYTDGTDQVRVYDTDGDYQGGVGTSQSDIMAMDSIDGGFTTSSGDETLSSYNTDSWELRNLSPPFDVSEEFDDNMGVISVDASSNYVLDHNGMVVDYSTGETVVDVGGNIYNEGSNVYEQVGAINSEYLSLPQGVYNLETGEQTSSGYGTGVAIHPEENIIYKGRGDSTVDLFTPNGDSIDTVNIPGSANHFNQIQEYNGELYFVYAGNDGAGLTPLPSGPPTISGIVEGKDRLQEIPLENANLTLYNQSTGSEISDTTTSANGDYSIPVSDGGQYEIEASRTGWISKSKSVDLTEDRTVNFTLRNKTEAFKFSASNFMEHGSIQEYSSTFNPPDSQRLEGVTSETTVTSENSSIVSVDSANNSLIATSDVSVNNRTTITAEYVRDNQTYTAVQEITVANRTMENIEIMPPSQYIPAALGFGEEGTVFGIGSEIQWVLLSVFIGSAAAWIARNEWVGVGIIIATHVFFWVLGNISLGITMVAVFYGLMAAYQLNKIPGRSDTNVGGNQDSPPPQPPQ